MADDNPKLTRREILATGALLVSGGALAAACDSPPGPGFQVLADAGLVPGSDGGGGVTPGDDASSGDDLGGQPGEDLATGGKDVNQPADDVAMGGRDVASGQDTATGHDAQTSHPDLPRDLPLPANVLLVTVSAHSGLTVGGAGAVISDNRVNDTICGISKFILFRVSQTVFKATSAACTHQCCLVKFSGGSLSCPCHGARFDTDGNVTRGPAQDPLLSFATSFDGNDTVSITF